MKKKYAPLKICSLKLCFLKNTFLNHIVSKIRSHKIQLRIGSCLAWVYRVMDACGKFGEHERSVRVAWSDSREQL